MVHVSMWVNIKKFKIYANWEVRVGKVCCRFIVLAASETNKRERGKKAKFNGKKEKCLLILLDVT